MGLSNETTRKGGGFTTLDCSSGGEFAVQLINAIKSRESLGTPPRFLSITLRAFQLTV